MPDHDGAEHSKEVHGPTAELQVQHGIFLLVKPDDVKMTPSILELGEKLLNDVYGVK